MCRLAHTGSPARTSRWCPKGRGYNSSATAAWKGHVICQLLEACTMVHYLSILWYVYPSVFIYLNWYFHISVGIYISPSVFIYRSPLVLIYLHRYLHTMYIHRYLHISVNIYISPSVFTVSIYYISVGHCVSTNGGL